MGLFRRTALLESRLELLSWFSFNLALLNRLRNGHLDNGVHLSQLRVVLLLVTQK